MRLGGLGQPWQQQPLQLWLLLALTRRLLPQEQAQARAGKRLGQQLLVMNHSLRLRLLLLLMNRYYPYPPPLLLQAPATGEQQLVLAACPGLQECPAQLALLQSAEALGLGLGLQRPPPRCS